MYTTVLMWYYKCYVKEKCGGLITSRSGRPSSHGWQSELQRLKQSLALVMASNESHHLFLRTGCQHLVPPRLFAKRADTSLSDQNCDPRSCKKRRCVDNFCLTTPKRCWSRYEVVLKAQRAYQRHSISTSTAVF